MPLADGAALLNYILHKGDEKDLPADQALDLLTIGNEVWIVSGEEGYLLPVQAGESAEPGDLATSEAHWLSEGVIAWDVDDADATYTLHTSADGGLELAPGGVEGGESYELEFLSETLPAELAAKWPHLAGYAALGVPEGVDAAEALKGQLAVSSARGETRTGATGVQVPGVLDDLYAGAAATSTWASRGTATSRRSASGPPPPARSRCTASPTRPPRRPGRRRRWSSTRPRASGP